MTEKNDNGKSMVIDASIARSAGETEHPVSKSSRDFLDAFYRKGHQLVMTEELLAEWAKHQSRIAIGWRRRMVQHGRETNLGKIENAELRTQIETGTTDKDRIPAILKDVHLAEAALATKERTVISKDDKIRNHFCFVMNHAEKLKCILWVNPTREEEKALKWLEDGAELDEARKLEHWLSK